MAFWGVEVKPMKPFTLKFSDFQAPRLHLSQATLGSRKSNDRTIVSCSVAEAPFVYLCSLLPVTAETCSLNLYFDEDVTFSVIGPTSAHLAGYFDGVFDGNEPGEDVEDDGYSEEEEDNDYDSMDGFIVSDDEESDDDDEDWSDDIGVRKSGVIIEELIDEMEVPKKSNVPVKGSSKNAKQSGKNGSVHADTAVNKKGDHKQENGSNNDADQAKEDSCTEDEDGFRVNRKRKHEEADKDQPSKKMLPDLQRETSEGVAVSEGEHEIDASAKGSSKKKKKKKKKEKHSSEDVSTSTSAQVNGSTPTPSKHFDSVKKGDLEKEVSRSVSISSDSDTIKKGTVRKHPNGLEIENIKMGKPDGKQATPGKKIGMIYTGRLRSNEKIFDSNVGRKPFFFRLGVGEVIKGWDIGVNGMRIGDKRRLVIPPAMGYGSKGVPGIPPNSWLKFDVELVEVK